MLDLAEEIDTAIAEAVKGLRACGYSWAEIGSRLGITRQAARHRWEHTDLVVTAALRNTRDDLKVREAALFRKGV